MHGLTPALAGLEDQSMFGILSDTDGEVGVDTNKARVTGTTRQPFFYRAKGANSCNGVYSAYTSYYKWTGGWD